MLHLEKCSSFSDFSPLLPITMSKCFSPAARISCFDWSEGSKTFSSLLHLILSLHFFNIVIFLFVYTLAVTSQPSNACMTKHSSHNSSLNLLFAYSISQIFVSRFTFEFYSHVRNTGCDVKLCDRVEKSKD